MANTYTLISSNVLTSSAASVTFSAIPATFTDLVVSLSARSDEAGQARSDIRFTINGTTANYSYTRLIGNGSTVTSSRISSSTRFDFGEISAATGTSDTFASGEIYIPSYLATQNKAISTFVAQENNTSSAFIRPYANLWNDTAAITSLAFAIAGGFNFVSGSSFYLYGVKNS
jgi:hypothetical protein